MAPGGEKQSAEAILSDSFRLGFDSDGKFLGYTLPETNITSENQWLEDDFPFGMTCFQRRLLLVLGGVLQLPSQN